MASKARMFSTKQVMAGFGVSDMTIYTWRQGTPTRDPLPTTVAENGRVSFAESDCKAYAKAHGLTFDVAKALAVQPAEKTGPKPEGKSAPKKLKLTPVKSVKLAKVRNKAKAGTAVAAAA